jgi:hypothetical protein
MSRRPLVAFKVYRKGCIMEVRIYAVPVSDRNPWGYRFRCFMVDATTGDEVLGYDNHWPKGPHRHFQGAEESYRFRDLETLMTDFERDCRRFLKEIEDHETS